VLRTAVAGSIDYNVTFKVPVPQAYDIGDRVLATQDIKYQKYTVPKDSTGAVVTLTPQLGVNWDTQTSQNSAVYVSQIELLSKAILTPRTRKGGETAAEELLHMLEGNSFELQRHRAEDWNLFVTILLQCLSGESKQKQDPFRV